VGNEVFALEAPISIHTGGRAEGPGKMGWHLLRVLIAGGEVRKPKW
jgi:hypothetical protein